MREHTNRIIGTYTGTKRGPLIIALGGMHGNEPAGVEALHTVFQMLEDEPLKNPSFVFSGKIIGLCGNLQAFAQKKRYLKKDLNRQWTKENVAMVKRLPKQTLVAEDLEMRELIDLINEQISAYQPDKIIILDLHTTSANGGVFTIATDDPESLRIAKAMHAPAVIGILDGLQGTTLHFFNTAHFDTPIVSVTFEAGHHDDPVSAQRATAAIINLLRSVGCVDSRDVENRHDEILLNYSKDLPIVVRLLLKHNVNHGDNFVMNPGYHNFQTIVKGEILAKDKHGVITAAYDGQILMPLYQPQGNDGFFLIEVVE